MNYSAYLQNLLSLIIKLDINTCIYSLIILLSMYLIIKLSKHRKRKLKRNRKTKNKGKYFYNTGFRIIFSAYDIIKFKLRLGDYCDKTGIRYCYLLAVKFFRWEFMRIKTQDQQGIIRKRKINIRS